MKLIWLFIVILIALVIVAIKFLPWWASLLVLLISLLGVRSWVNSLLQRAIVHPYRQKGRVLAQAVIKVHNLQPAPPSMGKAATVQSWQAESRDWYVLDLTITPTKGKATWWPNQLLLSPPDTQVEDLAANLDHPACLIHNIQIWQDQAFQEVQSQKYTGSQRLRLHIGVLPGVRHLKFRYYFEGFGDIFIPVTGITVSEALPDPTNPSPESPQQTPQPPAKSQAPANEPISPSLLALAQAGDAAAIATLLNQGLQPRGVRAKIRIRGTTLKVLLEAPTLPKQSRFAPMVYRGVIKLKIRSISQLQVHGRHIGEKEPAWSETFFLNPDKLD